MDITHIVFQDAVERHNDINATSKLILYTLFNHNFKLGFIKEFFIHDEELSKRTCLSSKTIERHRKELKDRGYLILRDARDGFKKTIYYTINYDKILNTITSTEEELTTQIPKKREKPTNTPTKVIDKSATPNQEDKPLSRDSNLLPPTPLTATKEEEIERNYTPQPEEETEFNFMPIFSDFKGITPQSDISISIETKVSEIAQNHPLNEDEHKEVNLAFNKDNNINENNEDMGEIKIGVLENLVSAFTKEELILWQDTLKNGNDTEFIESAANRVNSIAAEYRLKEEYVWRKLIEYVTTTQFETEPVQETINENEIDLDTIPAWIWDTLERVYVQNVKETEKDMWGDDVEVINRYLRPMKAIRPIYKMTLKKHNTEDKALLNRYAKIVYDDCAFAYKEYDKEIAA